MKPKLRLVVLLIALVALAVIAPFFWGSGDDSAEADLSAMTFSGPPGSMPGYADAAAAIIDWTATAPAPAATANPPEPIRAACTACHLFPPPDSLPRSDWPVIVQGMYEQAARQKIAMVPTAEQVTQWYQQHSPPVLPEAVRINAPPAMGPAWQISTWQPQNPPPPEPEPGVGAITFVALPGAGTEAGVPGARIPGAQMLLSDLKYGWLIAVSPNDPPGSFTPLAHLKAPCRVEPCDLDGDGMLDLVVADLGAFKPSDDLVGRVVWLRRTSVGMETIVLAENLPRVADVRPADLDGDGDLDLAVAVFGWLNVGHVMWMENTAGPNTTPTFTQHILDPRPGAIHIPVLDFDHDGDLDIIALLSQQHEQLMLYRRDGQTYTPVVLHQAPHPGWGYTGVQVVDIDSDGDPDFLLTNGDALDTDIVKPYQGIALLENRGPEGMTYRPLTPMYGAHSALAADYDGDGDLDITAVAYVPHHLIGTDGANVRLEGAIYLERIGPTQFRRHLLVPDRADFVTAAVTDLEGDGRADFAAGAMRFTVNQEQHWPVPFWVVLARQQPPAPGFSPR